MGWCSEVCSPLCVCVRERWNIDMWSSACEETSGCSFDTERVLWIVSWFPLSPHTSRRQPLKYFPARVFSSLRLLTSCFSQHPFLLLLLLLSTFSSLMQIILRYLTHKYLNTALVGKLLRHFFQMREPFPEKKKDDFTSTVISLIPFKQTSSAIYQ